ncbi:hypothetical protein [Bacillus suaedae]|uniref:Uncharacterized protein n=1 Tax=Halalkalibacter suaedae TaxID=2822140 RepID=A0A941ANS0_9BACI|nr:hypothetical protein [Bacillus suaedae]MBP3950652.1 hypothetical protein [Bacillus suaedae]
MTRDEIVNELKRLEMDDVLEIIEDAETGHLEELELVESIGLVYDQDLNREVINLLKQLNVSIVYLTDENED